ncbi:MAG TPA: hypothetical protein VFC78_12575 [Tepidisphaeraceae bacterium]|nr:hypothetical protein [Tepidisphaeraceae bacterium]
MRFARPISLIVAIVLCAAVPSRGNFISISDIKNTARLAGLGIRVDPTGPASLADGAPGNWEVLGTTAPYLDHNADSPYLSGVARLNKPAIGIALDVTRVNAAMLNDGFTLEGFYHGREVASEVVRLDRLGKPTHIEITAPAIDEIKWDGSGLVFHPYILGDFQIYSASPPASAKTAEPHVADAAPAPEPASLGILLFAGAPLMLRRRSTPKFSGLSNTRQMM